MMRRTFTREFKLDVCQKAESGEVSKSRLCREHSLSGSMLDRWIDQYRAKGDAAFAESFFARFKNEVIRLREPRTYSQTEQEVTTYVQHYNLTRTHSALGGLAPMTFENRIAQPML